MRRALLLMPLLLLTVAAGGTQRDADLLRPHLTLHPPAHADVVVFAPHPDGDVVELLARLEPSVVYTTMAADTHPDHAATFSIVNEALYRADYRGRFVTFLIHGTSTSWPWPQADNTRGRFLREAGALPAG